MCTQSSEAYKRRGSAREKQTQAREGGEEDENRERTKTKNERMRVDQSLVGHVRSWRDVTSDDGMTSQS